MEEVTKEGDIKSYKYYVVRNNILYKLKYNPLEHNQSFYNPKIREELELNEICCYISTTPSTPADIELTKFKNINNPLTQENFDEWHLLCITNMDYLNTRDIKNFILGIGEFKNWYN